MEEDKLEEKDKEEIKIPEKPKGFNSKIVIIGLPLFIVQLIVVYFVTANLLLSKITKANQTDSTATASVQTTAPGTKSKVELGKYIFSIEDIIVNPADTEGKRLLLTSVGFDLSEEPMLAEFKSKEVLLKDVIVSTLSSKTLFQLSDVPYRDTIKTEIVTKIKTLLPNSNLNAIYISKYIIQ